jgi:tRNA (guanine-N7-)-methyltransferase
VGEDGSRRRAEVGARLSGPPIGRVYGRRRARRIGGKKVELLGTRFTELKIALPDAPETIDPLTLFEPRPRAVWLEIGFGGGEHLAALAATHPDIGFIGCEPFLNGVSSLLVLLDRDGQKNVRIVADDARLLLQALPEASIGGAFLLFPDPWPKRRHEERRFLAQGLGHLARILADGAEFRMATDHAALGPWMEELMAERAGFSLNQRAETRPEGWPPTRYEAKALAAGRQPIYLAYRRNPRQN